MLYRKIASSIERHLSANSNRMLLISGARQVGKSYIIRHVGQRLFPNYIEINMEEDKLGDRLFEQTRTTNDFYLALSTIAGQKMKDRASTLIFIDEIQAYDHLLTLVKFLMQENRYTYIASGSLLGITLKNTQSLPLGSIAPLPMYPMDFEEFLYANGVGEPTVSQMRQNFTELRGLPAALHDKIMDLFKKYLIVGGFPKAVEAFVNTHNVANIRAIQHETHTLYVIDTSKYEAAHGARLKIQRIYDMVPSSLEQRKKTNRHQGN